MNDKPAHDPIRNEMQHLREVDRKAVPSFSHMMAKAQAEAQQRSNWRLPATAFAVMTMLAIALAFWLHPADDIATPEFSALNDATNDELFKPLHAMPTDFLLEIPDDYLASTTPDFLTTLPDYLIPEEPTDVH